jgi:hypothetical protein
MFDETYSLRLVTNYLKSNNIEYTHSSARVGLTFIDHGCMIEINDKYRLSIQTHPDVTGEYFAETALKDKGVGKLVYDGTFGYYDVRRFMEPQDLFHHIQQLLLPYDSSSS